MVTVSQGLEVFLIRQCGPASRLGIHPGMQRLRIIALAIQPLMCVVLYTEKK